ncbi:MAG: hypothetical protein GKR97_19260 [Rhizobiaceae bacterium]|nr:hypothetical protein [Rhizobiaceae bacterium]
MTTFALQHSPSLNFLEAIWKRIRPERVHEDTSDMTPEDGLFRDEIILEMLSKGHGPLYCEPDFQNMMYTYPCRY